MAIGGSSTILRKLDLQVDKLSAQESMSLTRSLISLGNEYPLTDRAETTSSAAISALGLIERLFVGLPVSDRELAIREIVRSSEPLHFVAAFLAYSISIMEEGQGLAVVVNSSFASEMYGIVAQRISSLARATPFSDLILSPFSRNLLNCWVRGSSRDEVESYLVEQFRADSDNLGKFLVRIAPKWTTTGQDRMQKSYVGDLDDEQYGKISVFMDTSVLQQEINRVYGDSVTDAQFVSYHNSDLPDNVRLAQQFICLHRKVEQEKEAVENEAGEVIADKQISDSSSQNEINES